jgi:hypothetical protein
MRPGLCLVQEHHQKSNHLPLSEVGKLQAFLWKFLNKSLGSSKYEHAIDFSEGICENKLQSKILS